MNQNLKIVALIPARSGSKGLKDKNIKLYKGIPLLAHSIKIGLKSTYINEVYVSTDSEEYQKIALNYNAKITPLRPKNISDDLSPDIEVFQHFINMFKEEEKPIPDLIIHLRPTYPNRIISVLNDCINYFLKNYENYDSLRTVIPLTKTPYKMYYIENDILIPYLNTYKDYIEPFNQARQIFPQSYLHNGYIDIIKTKNIISYNLLSGNNILPYIMEEDEIDDIDNLEEFLKAENKDDINNHVINKII